MVSSSINVYSYNISGGASGKLYVPVKPSAVIYSQFDHISGVAARKGQHGVSVTKIKILNTLIDNLTKIKSTPMEEKASLMSNEQADVLIKNYQHQIAQAMEAAKTSPFALAGARPEAGALFAIDA